MSRLKEILEGLHRQLYLRHPRYMRLLVATAVIAIAGGALLSGVHITQEKVVVTVDGTFSEPEVVSLFYTTSPTQAFTEQQCVQAAAVAKRGPQQLAFMFADTVPVCRVKLLFAAKPAGDRREIRRVFASFNSAVLPLFVAAEGIDRFAERSHVALDVAEGLRIEGATQARPFIVSSDVSGDYLDLLATRARFPFALVVVLAVSGALAAALIVAAPRYTWQQLVAGTGAFAFVMLLLLPMLSTTFVTGSGSSENRAFAGAPHFRLDALSGFPEKFGAYYDDHFGFRGELLRLGGGLRYWLFRSSATPRVAVGREGWLYLAGEEYGITQDLTRSNLCSPSQLAHALDVWRARSDSLMREGIRYLRVTWPDKHTVYPQFLPIAMRSIAKDTLSRAQQLLQAVNADTSGLRLLDATDALNRASRQRKVFCMHDSHWNMLGAYTGYSVMLAGLSRWFPDLQPMPEKDLQAEWREAPPGDLAKMLNVDIREALPQVAFPAQGSWQEVNAEGWPPRTRILFNPRATTELTLLLYRDSFGEALLPYLPQHFKKIVVLWDEPFSMRHVAAAKPDVVVEAYVARNLHE